MIPRAHVTAWRVIAPWPTDAQVEQDRAGMRPEKGEKGCFLGGPCHATAIETGGHLLRCLEYVDLNMVRGTGCCEG